MSRLFGRLSAASHQSRADGFLLRAGEEAVPVGLLVGVQPDEREDVQPCSVCVRKG